MKDHQIPAAAATAQDAAAARGAVDEPRDDPRVRAIDALLPQTQCRQCGFAGCLPYARALADGQSAINRCPPGGAAGIALLAQHLGQPVIDLDVSCGTHRALQVAQIDESRCIGCTLCIQACPVDAIAGAIKRMHSVLPEACTGCDLCVAPCPMDCIRMVPAVPARDWTRADADRARERLLARAARRIREAAEDDDRLAAKALRKLDALDEPGDIDASETSRRRAIIEQALARVGQRRAAAQGRRAPLPGGDPA